MPVDIFEGGLPSDKDRMDRLRGGYNEGRNLAYIEERLSTPEQPFSFRREMHQLAKQFPQADALEVLDGGCGEGRMLGEIKSFANEIGKPIHTTGVALEKDLIPTLEKEGVDTIIIAKVQDYEKEKGFKEGFHFVIDSSGAAYHNAGVDAEGYETQGEEVVPIYANKLVEGGRALLTFTYLHPGFVDFQGGRPHQNVLDLLKRNNLHILQSQGGYALVEKRVASAEES